VKRILIPTDFSRFARRAADRAAWLATGKRTQLHLVHVTADGSADTRRQAAAELARECVRLKERIAAAGIRRATITTTLLRGEPFVELIRHARELEPDLTVLGCKGAGARPRKVLGRTAARVARMAEIPVLVVRLAAEAMYRRPLVALPLDPSARRLVRLVENIVDPAALPLPAVRAYNVPFPGLIDAGSSRAPSAHHKESRAKAEAELREQISSLARNGVRLRPVLRWGDARSVILSESGRMKADLVALGTHARSGLAHMLLGSVAEWVLVNASADVLVARPVRFTFELP
jgi:nucleotide-binding universal stress UspA family protein